MGWVRVYENLSGHWLWEDRPFAKGQAWIDLLLDAEWRDGRQIRLGREIIVLKRGQQSVTLRDLADRWGWSKDKVSRFLKLLEEQGMISAEKTQAGQVLTIENYEKYQNDTRGERDTSETQVRHERDTSAKPSYLYQNLRISESQTKASPESAVKKGVFRPPSPDDVRAYAEEKCIDVDADLFCDFYASKGWKVGKNSMKDWRAAARGWAKRHQNNKPKREKWDFMDL